jgi:hypothetical protein
MYQNLEFNFDKNTTIVFLTLFYNFSQFKSVIVQGSNVIRWESGRKFGFGGEICPFFPPDWPGQKLKALGRAFFGF